LGECTRLWIYNAILRVVGKGHAALLLVIVRNILPYRGGMRRQQRERHLRIPARWERLRYAGADAAATDTSATTDGVQHYRRYGSSSDRALQLWDICVLGYRRYLRRQLQHVHSGCLRRRQYGFPGASGQFCISLHLW
jgi:hypothetical protein